MAAPNSRRAHPEAGPITCRPGYRIEGGQEQRRHEDAELADRLTPAQRTEEAGREQGQEYSRDSSEEAAPGNSAGILA
ncbi:MAG TPA: hypothetical protein VF148_04855 [Acidimicrobiia bacterium]